MGNSNIAIDTKAPTSSTTTASAMMRGSLLLTFCFSAQNGQSFALAGISAWQAGQIFVLVTLAFFSFFFAIRSPLFLFFGMRSFS